MRVTVGNLGLCCTCYAFWALINSLVRWFFLNHHGAACTYKQWYAYQYLSVLLTKLKNTWVLLAMVHGNSLTDQEHSSNLVFYAQSTIAVISGRLSRKINVKHTMSSQQIHYMHNNSLRKSMPIHLLAHKIHLMHTDTLFTFFDVK